MNSDDLQNKFDTLPQIVKDAITSVDFGEKLQKIGKDRGLHIDELDMLFEEVGFVMLGETSPREFKEKLAKRLSLTEEKVVPLVQKLDQEIFRPVKIALIESSEKSTPIGPTLTPAPQGRILEEASPAPTPVTKIPSVAPQGMPPPRPAPTIPPPLIKPHKEDYDMSRDAILSAIENPAAAEVHEEYVPRREPESTDPSQYLGGRKGLSAVLETPAANAPKKRSLSEEAVIVAKKKEVTSAAERPATDQPTKTPITPVSISSIKMVPPAVATAPPAPIKNVSQLTPKWDTSSAPSVAKSAPSAPTSPRPAPAPVFKVVPKVGAVVPVARPADKLTQVTHAPSVKTDLATPPPVPVPQRGVDPYREPIK